MTDSFRPLISSVGRRSALAGVAAATLVGRRARAADPIVIGWVGPLSPPGGYAEGTNMKNAAELAAKEINDQGGLLGRPVQIVYADTRGTPAEGRTAAERLVQQDKVVAVFGEFHSGVALAEMEVFHRYGIPFMACDVWSDAITAKGYKEVFRNAPTISLDRHHDRRMAGRRRVQERRDHRREGRCRPGRPHAGRSKCSARPASPQPRSTPTPR